ncbi:MAG: PD40 domain-containing protein [Candidatus Eisenbacteria bacterium]|nr:PD40 domain-containing protein [Candidatus Eisenbacteria bacterium]
MPKRIQRIATWAAALLLPALVCLPGCRQSAPDDLIQNEPTTDALVFVKTTGTETLNKSWAYGNLYKLSPIAPDGIVTPITNFTGATVSDPAVSFDGKKILFSLRRSGDAHRNIWEIDADGANLRQVTGGGGDDFDPLYLPDGRIMFTSDRDQEMDEYNHALAEHLYTCDMDGSNVERVSFNQSDDFDPTVLADGRILYTRWEHFGTMNRFPLFFTHPDGSGTFHMFGPHERNFFHPQPTPDGRIIAIESTMILGDAGPLAVLKLENGPADPAMGGYATHWDVVTPQVNNNGEPWPYGSFKYPMPIGGNQYVVSYSLPAATEQDVDYGLYTFTLEQSGSGTPSDPATFTVAKMQFLYNDPTTNEYDAQLLAPHPKPPVIPSLVDHSVDYGIFLGQDVFNRGTNDGQEVPIKGAIGLNHIDSIAVIAARPTAPGEANDFSANEFEKRALIGFAPVQSDGSFRIKVPADTPISFATLDSAGRGFVVKRTHLAVRPGEQFTKCVGCHEDRVAGGPIPTNPNPMAAMLPAHDLDIPKANWMIINYESTIGPIVAAKCASCHYAGCDTVPAAGTTLDLSAVPDTTTEMRIFPRGYINLSGNGMMAAHQVVDPPFPRRSILIDYVLGLGSQAGRGPHPTAATLTPQEKREFNLWVMLGAQYK